MMNSKQFAWAYLVKNGFANMRHSKWGGFDIIDPELPGKIKEQTYALTMYSWNPISISAIKEIGVDWEKTKAPEIEDHSMFAGTFCDPSQRQLLEGTLVLKDGTNQKWIAETLTTDVFEVMANINLLQNFYELVFGIND